MMHMLTPELKRHLRPDWRKGFLIVAILSAAMCSVSSALTSLASVSTMDFVKHVIPGRSEGFFLRFSKISTVFWAAALILVASLSRQVPFVLNAAFALRGLTSGALLGGLALAIFWKKGRGVPVITGMIVSLACMTAIQQAVAAIEGLNGDATDLQQQVGAFLENVRKSA